MADEEAEEEEDSEAGEDLTPFKQLLRCCRRRRLTAGSMPPKRPTSVAHSANPALNLLITAGSVA